MMLKYETGVDESRWRSFVEIAGDGRLRIIGEKAWLVKFIQFQFPRGLHLKDPARIAIQRLLITSSPKDLLRGLVAPNNMLISSLIEGANKELARSFVAPQEKEPEKEKKGGMGMGETRKFQKPSIESLKLHCAKIGLPESEAEKFWHYHESRGWSVGKSPMRSWVSAMATWRGNFDKFNGQLKPATETEADIMRGVFQ